MLQYGGWWSCNVIGLCYSMGGDGAVMWLAYVAVWEAMVLWYVFWRIPASTRVYPPSLRYVTPSSVRGDRRHWGVTLAITEITGRYVYHRNYSKTCLYGRLRWEDDLWSGDIFVRMAPCDWGHFSYIFPMLRNLWWRDTCHVGTLSLGYWGVPWKTGFTVFFHGTVKPVFRVHLTITWVRCTLYKAVFWEYVPWHRVSSH